MYIRTLHLYMYICTFQPETILCLSAFVAIEVRFSNKTLSTIEGKVVSIGVELSGAIFTKNLRFNIFCFEAEFTNQADGLFSGEMYSTYAYIHTICTDCNDIRISTNYKGL